MTSLSSSKRQKKNSSTPAASSSSVLLTPGFSREVISKYLHERIALTDEVYAARDRDESVSGYHYIYQVIEVISARPENKLKCKYLEERIKDGDPLATFEGHRDTYDLQAEETHVIDASTYSIARARYKDHNRRVKELATAAKKAEEEEAGIDDEVVLLMTQDEEDELWCRDLIEFVAANGVNGKDESGRALIDLQFEIITSGTKETKKGDGTTIPFTERRNVSNKDQTFVAYDTGAVWRRIHAIADNKSGRRDQNIVRCRFIAKVKDNKCTKTNPSITGSAVAVPTKRDIVRAEMQVVLGAVYGHIPHNAMRNSFMTSFLAGNVVTVVKYPHWAKAMKLLRVIADVVMEEVASIVSDCSRELHHGPFASLASNFYRDASRRQDFGALTVCLIGEMYRQRHENKEVFVSKKTMARLTDHQRDMFHGRSAIHPSKISSTKRDVATLLLDFVAFEISKTAINCGEWIADASKAKGLLPSYVHSKNVDGAAMSGGQAYSELTQDGRRNNMEINHCGFHCNNLASKEGLGLSTRIVNENKDLGVILRKVHKVLAKMNKKGTFMKAYRSIQQEKGRVPCIPIRTANETRADGWMVEVEVFNTARADIIAAFNKTVGPNLSNAKYLEDSDDEDEGVVTPAKRLLPDAEETEVLRQIECGYEPVVELSKFTQSSCVIIFNWLFMIRHTCQEMLKPTFVMYEDISLNSGVTNLRGRQRNVIVQSHSLAATAHRVAGSVPMKQLVEQARRVYTTNMQLRFGLTDEDGNDVRVIRKTVIHGAILNPLLGSVKDMLTSSLMTKDQQKNGVEMLIRIIEDMYDNDTTTTSPMEDDSDDEAFGGALAGLLHTKQPNAYHKAVEEVSLYLYEYRKSHQLPVFEKNNNTKYLHGTISDTISDGMITLGDVVKERGHDLPSGKNIADYFKLGHFDHISFWLDHQEVFPKLWMYAVQIASANPTEVSCEALFSQSGYASTSRRTRLKSATFERETMLAYNLQKVYFDLEHAVNTYMKRAELNNFDKDEEYRDDLFYLEQEQAV